MPPQNASIRFESPAGTLRAVSLVRAGRMPLVAKLHRALFALGVVVTTYQVQALPEGLSERLELAPAAGGALDAEQSRRVQAALLPLLTEDA